MASSATAWNHSATSTSTSPPAAEAIARHRSASAATDLPTCGASRCARREGKDTARISVAREARTIDCRQQSD